MLIGLLRKRVTFQARSSSVDSLGGQLTTWSDLFTTWAEILPLTGRELELAQTQRAGTTHQITVRYRSEFAIPANAAALRAVYQGRYFDLGPAINEGQFNRSITFTATEGLSNG